MKNLIDWNLKSKIIFHITIIGILVAIILTFLFIETQKNLIQSMNINKAETLGSTFEFSIRHIMKEGKADRLSTFMQGLTLSSKINRIRVLNTQGKISHSSTPEEDGSYLDENTFRKLKNYFSEPDPSGSFIITHKFSLQAFHIIKNTEDCLKCHSKQNDVNGILEVDFDYSDAVFLLRKSQAQGVIIALVALAILSFIVLRLFNKIINRPLFQLKKAMTRMQEGDLSIHLPIRTKDEIGSLAESFNILAQKLERANRKIENLFNTQMEKAEHLASLGEIAAGLAHEIKNPIAGIKGALEIIHKKTEDSDSNKEIFKEILVQIDKIHQIIQDLMRYARPKEIDIKLVSIEDCVESALKLAQMQVKNKNIQFHVSSKEKNIQVRLDVEKIKEVLLNLMLNSIGAIVNTGNITIAFGTESEKNLKITVTDDGSGINKDQLSQIFQPFFTTKSEGTGLGLSICKKIIAAHSGTLEVESEEGEGTTFRILLPVVESKENS